MSWKEWKYTSENEGVYQTVNGSLTYAAMSTRPDTTAALGSANQWRILAQDLIPQQHWDQRISEAYWKVATRALRYLKGTLDHGISLNGNTDTKVVPSGFRGRSLGWQRDNAKSQSGYVFQLCGGPISWISNMQATVALSTTEAAASAAQGN